ncbi:hypothetical protein [Jiangella endophytica]|uniref:hypothetical protein n=1 Tax=Jiangella endophytica TaxID=1623398 RepID=UPI0013004996|nr:hypothetical protein [Jiangella endophytica]
MEKRSLPAFRNPHFSMINSGCREHRDVLRHETATNRARHAGRGDVHNCVDVNVLVRFDSPLT